MNYITATSIGLNYVIPPALAANSVQGQYHVEVQNMSTGKKVNYPAGAVVAAIAPVGNGTGTAGSVAFSGLATPDDGSYMLTVCYADAGGADLDAVGAGFIKVSTAAVHKVAAVTTVTA